MGDQKEGMLDIKPLPVCGLSCGPWGWQPRRFELRDRKLRWFKEGALDGTLLPDDVIGVEELPPQCFNIVTEGRVFQLRAGNTSELRSWARSISTSLVPAAASSRGRTIRIEVLNAVDVLNTEKMGEWIESRIVSGGKLIGNTAVAMAYALKNAATGKETLPQEAPAAEQKVRLSTSHPTPEGEPKSKDDEARKEEEIAKASKLIMWKDAFASKMDHMRFLQKMDVVVRVRTHHTKVSSTPPAWNQGCNPTFDWSCTFAYENETHIDFDLYDKDLLGADDIIGTGRIAIEKAGVGWKTPAKVNIYFYNDRSSIFAGSLFVKAEFIDYGEMQETPAPDPEVEITRARAKQAFHEKVVPRKAIMLQALLPPKAGDRIDPTPPEAMQAAALLTPESTETTEAVVTNCPSVNECLSASDEQGPGTALPEEEQPEDEEPWHKIAAREEVTAGMPKPVVEEDTKDWTELVCPDGTRAFVRQTLKGLGLVTNSDLRQFWRILDYNGNNLVSLAEVDKLVVEFVASKTWPEWLNNKPALLLAFNDRKDISRGGGAIAGKKANVAAALLRKHELQFLLGGLVWYNRVWAAFDLMDEGDDRRIEEHEFVSALTRLGVNRTRDQLVNDFARIDVNGGGKVLFGEFCIYLKKSLLQGDAKDTQKPSSRPSGIQIRSSKIADKE